MYKNKVNSQHADYNKFDILFYNAFKKQKSLIRK
jgi:hypothetical protein